MARSRKLPNFLRAHEAEALLAAALAAHAEAGSVAKKRSAEVDHLVIQAGLYLGLRVSEICKLKIEDLDLAQGTALVYQGKGNKDRYVPIPARFIPTLKTWLGERGTGYVFPSPRGGKLSSRTLQLRLKALGKKAQIPRALKPHTLRHTYATRLLEKGANIREVQELLGHSSIQTTEIYTHTVPERLRGAVEKL